MSATLRRTSPPPADPVTDWDARAARYDGEMRAGLPGYETLHAIAAGALRARLGREARVLVVGCGTGEELTRLAGVDPSWSLTGVDPPASMLARAHERLEAAAVAGRVALHQGVLADLPTVPAYDAATLLLVMHFLPDDGAKLDLIRDVATRLRPGASLVLADMHGDPGAPATRAQWAAWRGTLLAAGAPADRVDAGLAGAHRAAHSVSERRVAALLREAGFRRIVPLFRALLVGAWIADRAKGRRLAR